MTLRRNCVLLRKERARIYVSLQWLLIIIIIFKFIIYIANEIYKIYISYIKHLQELIVEAILPYLAIDVPMGDKVRDRPNIGAKENVHGILIVILSADV